MKNFGTEDPIKREVREEVREISLTKEKNLDGKKAKTHTTTTSPWL